MLKCGKKFALCATKKNILTFVMSEKKILNETKNHNPPLQVKWSVPNKFKFKFKILLSLNNTVCDNYTNYTNKHVTKRT